MEVAPYVGAWIETSTSGWRLYRATVAPYVGAWIETQREVVTFYYLSVAPYVGAWIETLDIPMNRDE